MDADTAQRHPPVHRAHAVVTWLGMATLLCVVVGGLAALFWSMVVELPTWSVATDGSATMTEAGWTQMMGVDAWFAICAAPVGLGIGWVVWRWFKPLGWPAAIIVALAGLLTGLVCWQLGEVMGPGPFADRIAAASPGQLVPAAMDLQAKSALLVWPMAALLPVLFGAAFARDRHVAEPLADDADDAAPGDDEDAVAGEADV